MHDVTRRTVLGGGVAGMLFGSAAVRPATATRPWPTYQGDAGRTGYTAAIPTTASVEWELDLESRTGASPVVAGDRVYVGADGVYAIDRSDGRVAWHTPAVGPVGAAVCVTTDLVVGLTLDWEAFALERETGDRRWSIPTDGRSHAAPLVHDGTAYVRDDRRIRAVDLADGEERWVRDLDGGKRPPAFGDRKVYVGDRGGNLYAIERSGELAWHRAFPAPVRCAPTYVDGTVYVGWGSSTGRIDALDADDGSERWHVPTPAGRPYASPAVTSSHVYMLDSGSGVTDVRAVERDTGSEAWKRRVDGESISSPAVDDATLVFGTTEGAVHAIDTGDGSSRWAVDVGAVAGAASPAVADGTVYVSTIEGSVVAISADGSFLAQPGLGVGSGLAGVGAYLWYRARRGESFTDRRPRTAAVRDAVSTMPAVNHTRDPFPPDVERQV